MSPSIHKDQLGDVVVQAFKRNTIDTNWLDGLIRERVVRLKYECLGNSWKTTWFQVQSYSEVFEMYCSLNFFVILTNMIAQQKMNATYKPVFRYTIQLSFPWSLLLFWDLL